nr:unnamed protein product [Callosobruchus analis]
MRHSILDTPLCRIFFLRLWPTLSTDYYVLNGGQTTKISRTIGGTTGHCWAVPAATHQSYCFLFVARRLSCQSFPCLLRLREGPDTSMHACRIQMELPRIAVGRNPNKMVDVVVPPWRNVCSIWCI